MIEAYNYELILNNKKILLQDYINYVVNTIYSKIKINPTIVKIFLNHISNYNKFHIDKNILNLFGIIKKSNNYKHIFKKFISYNLVYKEDFVINNRQILLTSYAFKICLSKNNHTKEFCNHFKLLENICLYYRKYKQALYIERLLTVIAEDHSELLMKYN